MATARIGIKGTAIQTPQADPATHMVVLRQLKEVAEIGQRLRGDPGDSFVRVSELVNLGLVRLVNDTLQPYQTSGATASPVTSSRNIFTTAPLAGGGALTADLTLTVSLFGSAAPGIVPASGGGSSNFLRADGSWAAPASVVPDFMAGATWVASSGAVTTPTNDVLFEVPRACTLKEVTILGIGGPGSCTIDIWKSTYSSYPPVVGGSICGGTPPAIAAASKYTNTTLSGWTTGLSAGDILLFHISASTTFSQVRLSLRMG